MHTCELSTFVCSSRMHGLDHLESGQLGISISFFVNRGQDFCQANILIESISISLDLFVFYLNNKKTFLLRDIETFQELEY